MSKITFEKYGTVKRAVTLFVTNTKKRHESVHNLVVQTAYHGYVTGDYSLLNTVLRAVADSDRRYIIKAIASVTDKLVMTVTNWTDGNGAACFVRKNRSKQAIDYTEQGAAEIAASIPFFKQVERDHKAAMKAERDARNAAKAEAARLAATEAAIEAEQVNSDAASGTVHVYTSIMTLAAHVEKAVTDGTIVESDQRLAKLFINWFKRQQAALDAVEAPKPETVAA